MKKITEMKSGTKKQILSGMVYIALAVTVVSVTIGSVVTSFSKKEDEVTKNKGGDTIYNGGYTLKLPEQDISIKDFNLDTPVSDSPSGIDALISAPSDTTTIKDDTVKSVTEPENVTATESIKETTLPTDTKDKTVPVSEEPGEVVFEYGYDGFIKPCSGYISKEFSMDIPVYSVSMYDYRTHNGIDIVAETGTPVKATSNGVISEIYDDYLYGTTVVIEHKDGIKSVYSNLSADLPAETVEGRAVITGEVIAGIGETAACEAAEAKHLHFEMIKDGKYVNPEDYLVN